MLGFCSSPRRTIPSPPAHQLSLATLTAREVAEPGPRFKGGCISSSPLTFLDSSSREKRAPALLHPILCVTRSQGYRTDHLISMGPRSAAGHATERQTCFLLLRAPDPAGLVLALASSTFSYSLCKTEKGSSCPGRLGCTLASVDGSTDILSIPCSFAFGPVPPRGRPPGGSQSRSSSPVPNLPAPSEED